MMINKDNYELFAMDYIDGTLDDSAKLEMDRFLKNHPSIQTELIGLEQLKIAPDLSIVYEPKNRLLKKERALVFKFNYSLLKYAAAIVLLIALGWTLMTQFNNSASQMDQMAIQLDQELKNEEDADKTEGGVPIIKTENDKTLNSEIALKENEISPGLLNTKSKNKTAIEPKQAINYLSQQNDKALETKIALINQPKTQEEILSADTENNSTTDLIQTAQIIKIETAATLSTLDNQIAQVDYNPEYQFPINLIADYKAEAIEDKKKNSWLLDAITKKADGSKIFAFEGVKRALTPTRYRDAQVDNASTDSPIKQLTND